MLLIGPASYFYKKNEVNQLLSVLNYDICQSIRLGDSYRIQKLSQSLTTYLLNSLVVKSNSGFVIAEAENSLADRSREKTNHSGFSITKIFSDKTGTCASATAFFDLNYLVILFILVGMIAFLYLLKLALISALSDQGKKIASPLEELNKYVTLIDPITLSDKPIENKPSILELENIYESFVKLLNKSRDYQIKLVGAEKNAAIARTTQMLAHDVRKPFTMIEALIQLVADTSDPDEIKVIMSNYLPTVSSAIKSVNGMIQDVMEIGNKPNLVIDQVNIRNFIFNNLTDQFQFQKNLDINIEYQVPRHISFYIDELKYSRVFNNIVGNAIEHMKGRGRLWFNIEVVNSDSAKFIIGNSNTFISQEDIERLFDAFFTKDKQGGTGLGLAIAKKIVEAHNGEIKCYSDRNRGTEFVMTLPIKTVFEEGKPTILYSKASQYCDKKLLKAAKVEDHVDDHLLTQVSKSKLRIAIADDEKIYIQSLQGQIKSISSESEVSAYPNGEALVSGVVSGFDPHIIILDVDFGKHEKSGFEISKELRRIGFKKTICIHSNRGRLEYQPLAIEAGADFFVPKPMSKPDLANIIQTRIPKRENLELESEKKILLFEDEAIFQRRWRSKSKPIEVVGVNSWREFAEEYSTLNWDEIDYVVMDLNLAYGENGEDATRNIRRIAPDVPVYLSTNADEYIDSEGLFNLIVGKDPSLALVKINKAKTKVSSKKKKQSLAFAIESN